MSTEWARYLRRALDSISGTQITSGTRPTDAPSWSADASRIYFASGSEVYVTGATGGSPQLLLQEANDAQQTRSGRLIAFERNLATWLADADGSNAKPFPADLPKIGIRMALAAAGCFSCARA